MTQTLGIDKSNDLYLGPDGNIALLSGIDAVMNACQTAAQAQLGEMILALDKGVPNLQTIWQSSRNVAQFEAYLRATISSVDGVKKINELTVTLDADVIKYAAVIETVYGVGQLNG